MSHLGLRDQHIQPVVEQQGQKGKLDRQFVGPAIVPVRQDREQPLFDEVDHGLQVAGAVDLFTERRELVLVLIGRQPPLAQPLHIQRPGDQVGDIQDALLKIGQAGQGQDTEVVQQRGHERLVLHPGQHLLHPETPRQLRDRDPRLAIERLDQQVLAVWQVRDIDQFATVQRQILVQHSARIAALGL